MLQFLLIATLICCPFWSFALDFPPPPKERVNDYAGILSSQEKAELESMLLQHETETSNQIVVAIFQTLEQESLEDYVNRLFENWKIGQRVNNNGVLLAIFLNERKIRIEVGYGLESKLTDALSSRIIRDDIGPEFRAGHYASGIRRGLQAIQKAIAGEYKPLARPEPGNEGLSPATIFLLIVIFLYIMYRIRNQAMYLPEEAYDREERNRRRRRRRDDDWFIFPGGGSGWGSGGGGGGGFSGGGGSSGGGGASGSW